MWGLALCLWDIARVLDHDPMQARDKRPSEAITQSIL
jgi:hypothetical protein